MVCRASRYSSALVTFARDMTGLQDNQVLSINHQLMRESENVRLENQDTLWQEAIDTALDDYRAGRVRIARSSNDPTSRLEAARSEVPDNSRIYAGRRLIAACEQAEAAQNRYLEKFARDTGISYQAARSRFDQGFGMASEHSQLSASPRFVTYFTNHPDHGGISRDRRTMYALELMETSRLVSLAENREPRASKTLELEIRNEETAAAEIRWSANGEHIEIDYVDPQEGIRTEFYRGDSSLETRLTQAQNGEAPLNTEDFISQLRDSREHHYASHREAAQNRWNYRCASCGQFANSSHYCPVSGAPTSIELEIAYLAGLHVNEQGEVVQLHQTASTHTQRYLLEDGSVRMPGISSVQTNARMNDATEFAITSEINGYHQSGVAEVVYNGYGNGYNIGLARNAGDAGDRRLACSCPEYQERRDCHHINILEENLSRAINEDSIPSIAEIRDTTSSVLSEIETDRQASVSSAINEADAWVEPSEPLMENYETFQTIYREARDKRNEWIQAPDSNDFPLNYRTENAFNGLSTRENGRGFGIEIEFAFPEDMSPSEASQARENIARELSDLGLVSGTRIRHYGASHGWVRDTHTRGWSIEEDFTAGGRDGHSPAEIVSPIMYDEPETWENIDKICEIVKRNGGFASRGAGQHVHVSTGDYDHRVVNHNRLLSLIAENEDLLYRMSVNPERGRHRGYGYCAPNQTTSTPYTRITHARQDQSGHNLGVNFQSVSGRDSDHAEFRMFDSSLHPAVIQAQIGMSLALAAAAKRDVISDVPSENRVPLGTRLEANPRRNALSGSEWKEQTVPVRNFIDKYIPTAGESATESHFVKQLIGLFAMTKWQKAR